MAEFTSILINIYAIKIFVCNLYHDHMNKYKNSLKRNIIVRRTKTILR